MLLFILFLASIPTIFWFFIFLREEKYDSVPRKLISKVFFIGALSGFLAGTIEFVAYSFFPKEVGDAVFANTEITKLALSIAVFSLVLTVLAAAVEEILKIYSVKWFAFDNLEFNQVVDGAVLGISAGLGFATLENFGYFLNAWQEGIGSLLVVFVVRFLATTLLHAITAGIAGYYLGKVKFGSSKGIFWEGLLAAILIHATFNILLFSQLLIGLFLNIILLVGMLIFLLKKMDSTEAQMIWRLVLLRPKQKPPVSSP